MDQNDQDGGDPFDRPTVQKKQPTLTNLVYTLRPAFELLSEIQDKNVILCFGTTGCGKSTMLNSLVFGSDQMQISQHEEEITLRNGTTRINERQVIELINPERGFKIGHSRVVSQTFIPGFLHDPDASKNLVWADVAGFTDAGGDLIEFINQFINKKIFLIAKEVKIVVPFTEGQFKEQKGNIVGQIIQLIQKIFCDYLGNDTFSIQPIVTQVDPKDDEFDIDIFKDSFDKSLKNQLKNQFPQFAKEIDDELAEIDELEINEHGQSQIIEQEEEKPAVVDADAQKGEDENGENQIEEKPDKKKTTEFDEDGEIDEDQQFHREQYNQVRAFFEFFVEKIRVFDPLDRVILGDDDNGDKVQINIKSAKLQKAIQDMESMDSRNMNIPLENEKYKILLEMLNEEKRICMEKAESQLQEARNKGNQFDENFADQTVVQQFKSNMEFMIEHNLLEDITQIYQEFTNYVETITVQTNQAKMYGQASNIVKLSYEYADDMVQRQGEKRWNLLVKKMIQIHNNIEELKSFDQFESPQQKTEVITTIAQMESKIQETSAQVCANHWELFCFAYEVRKQDAEQEKSGLRPKDFYTTLLLGGVQMDEIQRSIIHCNHWKNDKMVIEPETLHYEMRIGDEFKYELRSAISTRSQESPFIISYKNEECYVDQSDTNLLALLARLQIFFDRVPQMIRDKWGSGDIKMQFILSSRGLMIQHQDKRFICRNGEVEQGSSQSIICGNNHVPNFLDDRCTLFYLMPKEGQNLQQQYYIQIPFGETKPRLKPMQIKPNLWSKLIATTRKQDGYWDRDQTLWKIRVKHA